MDIDIESLKQAFGTLATAINVLKQAKELLPDGSKKDDIDEALKKAERQLNLAEAQAAESLGYQLCKNHFPPEIMLSLDDVNWKCSKCYNEKNTGPAGTTTYPEDSNKKRLFRD
jgi:ActR/RegA family two-component response regulator